MIVDTDTLPDTSDASARAPEEARRHERPVHVPVSWYRVQFHAGFTFEQAQALVPYWQALGITDLYASPVLAAGRGSTHGYDISDHEHLNPALGGEDSYTSLTRTLSDA